MVAYSYKERFIAPITKGLGRDVIEGFGKPIPVRADIRPKRQTIRAVGKRRHARPGEVLQLYYGQRTKWCKLIGTAKCVAAIPIRMQIALDDAWLWVQMGDDPAGPATDEFAQADGFGTVEDMWLFWRREHPDVRDFQGVLIRWEPINE